MADKLGLINTALVLIGDLPLVSLTSGTRSQVVATQLYNNIVQDELSKFRWGFARKQAQLALTTGVPIGTEWQSIYQLPSDLLVLIKIDPKINYQILGDKLYCNYSGNLYCDYICSPAESTWPVYFSRMAEYALAMDFAPAIRDSAASMEILSRQYLNASRMARYTDSQQHPQTPIQDQPFINVRF
tara:strand:+ start:1201 stop:1758 length:558 start_codon:yes stop_codon:yes gene_type:complete